MRALLIFSSLNDLKFICSDGEFKRHIFKQAVKEGLLQDDGSASMQSLDSNIVMQLLSPLVASQRFMSGQLHNPYHSITLDGQPPFTLAFQQFSDHLYLAMNGDGGENDQEENRTCMEQFLHRQLLVLHSIITFLYGPVIEELYPSSLRQREERHMLITHMVNTWNSLYLQEQGFLFEALEKLMVRDRSLNSTCIDILEGALSTMKTAGEKGANHAMILVNNKLLSLFSSRNAPEIPPVNILLILILIGATFPASTNHGDDGLYSSLSVSDSNDAGWTATDSPAFEHQSLHSVSGGRGPVRIGSRPTSSVEATVSGDSTSETQDSSDDHKPSSSTSSDIDHDVTARDYSQQDGGPYPELSSLDISGSLPNLTAFTLDDPAIDVTLETEVAQEANELRGHQDGKSGSAYEIGDLPVQQHRSLVVVMRTVTRSYSPHVLHCMLINPGTVAIIACEMSRSRIAIILSELLSLVRGMLRGNLMDLGLRNGKHAQDMLDNCMKKLATAAKKIKEESSIRLVKELQSKWEGMRGSELQATLNKGEPVIDRFERPLSVLEDFTKRLFNLLYLSHNRQLKSDSITESSTPQSGETGIGHARGSRADINNALKQLQQTFRDRLKDYQHYLPVKAERNITMSTYYSFFPGLVHFVYVDRRTSQITAPAISVGGAGDGIDMAKVVKKQLWFIIPWIQTQLMKGYTSMIVRRGDFVFTYFLWFEDPMGNAIQVQQPYRGKEDGIFPGILTGDFYKALCKDCFPGLPQKSVNCFEMLCVHTSSAPTPYILHHCRKLARELWGSTGDANSPISLL